MRYIISFIVLLSAFLSSNAQPDRIPVITPEANKVLSARDGLVFRWESFEAMDPGAAPSYEVLVVELLDGQTPEEALVENDSWYFYETSPTTQENFSLIGQRPHSFGKYVLQITAFSGMVKVAESDIITFFGPYPFTSFFAGDQIVRIDTFFTEDLNNLSGIGQVRLTRDFNLWTTDIPLEGLRISRTNAIWGLRSGEIVVTSDTIRTFDLTPKFPGSIIDPAFSLESYVFDKNGRNARGDYSFTLPEDPENIITLEGQTLQYIDFSRVSGFIGGTKNLSIDILPNATYVLDTIYGSIFNETEISLSGVLNYKYGEGDMFTFPINSSRLSFFGQFLDLADTISEFSKPISGVIRSNQFILDASDTLGLENFDPAFKGLIFLDSQISLDSILTSSLSLKERNEPITLFLDEFVFDDTPLIQTGKSLFSGKAELNDWGFDADSIRLDLISENRTFQVFGEFVVDIYGEESLPIFYQTDGENDSLSFRPSVNDPYETLRFPLISDTSNIGLEGFSLHWIDTTEMDDYVVEVSADQFENVIEFSASENTLLIEGLESSTTYEVRVRRNSIDRSFVSSSLEIRTKDRVLSSSSGSNVPKIRVYPNPSSGPLEITGIEKNREYGLVLRDVSGSTLIDGFISGEHLNLALNGELSKVNPGIYFLRISIDDYITNEKIILR